MQIVARYHEIALKGRNRPFFIERLAQNLRRATADLGKVRVSAIPWRLVLDAEEGVGLEVLRERIASVFGVANFSPVLSVAPDLESLKEAALKGLASRRFGSFRVTTKRSFKGFPLNSGQVDRELGAAIQAATGARVDLESPELTVFVEILKDRIFVAFDKFSGPGGFPVGSSGKVLALLSGGIDSPVAAFRMMKRGCTVLLAHFHAFPLQDHTTIDKARELSRILTRYQFRTQLLLIPFGKIQQTIVACCPAPLRVVIYRRFMVRIAEALAERFRAKALVTGESLGQVASQTLDNMRVIDAAALGPILRPLVGMDKEEIILEARRIGSFVTSILPDQDCCQLFVPRSPAIAARLDTVLRAEEALDGPGLVHAAVSLVEVETYRFPEAEGEGEA
jgi:thiamine biosynthesis protein ThiI